MKNNKPPDIEPNIQAAELMGWSNIESFDMPPRTVGYPPESPIIGEKHKIPNPYWDLNDTRSLEVFLFMRDSVLTGLYEEELRKTYLKAVGYQGCDCWFFANSGTRTIAALNTVKKNPKYFKNLNGK